MCCSGLQLLQISSSSYSSLGDYFSTVNSKKMLFSSFWFNNASCVMLAKTTVLLNLLGFFLVT